MGVLIQRGLYLSSGIFPNKTVSWNVRPYRKDCKNINIVKRFWNDTNLHCVHPAYENDLGKTIVTYFLQIVSHTQTHQSLSDSVNHLITHRQIHKEYNSKYINSLISWAWYTNVSSIWSCFLSFSHSQRLHSNLHLWHNHSAVDHHLIKG